MDLETPSIKDWPQEIKLSDTNFSFFKSREFGQGVLYKSEDSYLRLGDAGVIEHELDCHQKFEQLGFPVAKILDDGTYEKSRFYIEENIGTKPFHEIFQEETEERGEISNETFSNFLSVVKRCVDAQSAQASLPTKEDVERYFKVWFLEDVGKDAPQLQELLVAAKKKAEKILESLPAVLSHNDFNAYNILPEGIIDFSYGQIMPLGYDWTSVLMHIEFFPVEDGLEQRRKYDFTEEQKEALESLFSNALKEKGLEYQGILPTLFLGRAVWAAAHMNKHPKIQSWRFKKLEGILGDYLKD